MYGIDDLGMTCSPRFLAKIAAAPRPPTGRGSLRDTQFGNEPQVNVASYRDHAGVWPAHQTKFGDCFTKSW
jgi:hypothetical protein